MYSEVVEERGPYRARMTLQEYADAPYDMGSVPILRLSDNSASIVAGEYGDLAALADAWEALCDQGGYGTELFERYLRIFHGATSIATYDSGNFIYIAFDTAVWREAMGITDEHRAATPEHKWDEVAHRSLAEIQAWAEGDVWCIVLERRVITCTTTTDEDGNGVGEPVWDREWQEVDDTSCADFYGRDYAESAAKELLTEAEVANG